MSLRAELELLTGPSNEVVDGVAVTRTCQEPGAVVLPRCRHARTRDAPERTVRLVDETARATCPAAA